MDISIIIVNWKVKDLLSDCLHSIFSYPQGKELEVIVIDNSSRDGSVDMVKREFPQAKLIANKENYGFAKACNQGIGIARGRYLFFLNPDSELTPGVCNHIVDFMDSHPDVGIGGCLLYYPDGTTQTSLYRFTSIANSFVRASLLYFLLPRNHLTAPLFCDYLRPGEPADRVCGGAMVVRRDVLDQVGGFDESFFLYSEDEELSYRAARQGWKTSPIPDTRVIHHHNQSGMKNVRAAIYFSYRGQFLFYRKFHPLLKVILFRVIQFMGVSIRSLFWFLRAIVASREHTANQKFKGYLSLLLSDFSFRRSLLR
jgi:GT2 family glycosyltransferase